ncbi:MAG TPA: DUF2993 domain-containing protein [Leptolyngbyaceae cyanobacterium M65_K2018_010]|nr:DUF2993 domain-containing protein [Leptolyngbyaceae cyanobacterium M65_K2018_010]
MDIVTLIVSVVMGLLAPVGFVVDTLAEEALRGQIAGAEELYLRIDNVPNYQLLNGRIDHARIAARGLYFLQLPDLRIDAIDLETDVVDVDFAALQGGELKLDEPVQVALRLQLKASDLNAFLASPLVQGWLDTLRITLPGATGERERNRYGLANPTLEFLAGDRFRLTVDLVDRVLGDTAAIEIDIGLGIVNGSRFELIDPKIEIDGEPAPPQLITSLTEGASQEFTLKRLEEFGLIARVLAFDVRDNELDLAVFARLEPDSPFLRVAPADEAALPTP